MSVQRDLKAKTAQLLAGDPVIMGVVNVTPDSFSDGGKYISKNKAVEHAHRLIEEGATILDVGGESTRPGAQAVDIQEEIDRVCPVIEELSKFAPHISIDTRNAKTMRAAIKAGATAINDISALTHDVDTLYIVKNFDGAVFVMHMQGNPQNMQKSPHYDDIIDDIYKYLQGVINRCATFGIDINRLVIDPGIGFGKTLEHNLLILRNIKKFSDLSMPLLLGTSRKSFIGKLDEGADANQRLGGSLASVLYARSQGVKMFRVHDVKETVQALKIYDAIADSDSESAIL